MIRDLNAAAVARTPPAPSSPVAVPESAQVPQAAEPPNSFVAARQVSTAPALQTPPGAHLPSGFDVAEQAERTRQAPRVPTVDLARGSTAPQVVQLQRCLVALGLFPEDKVGAFYGPITQEAVATVQRRHGIHDDGGVHFGPRTRAALKAELAKLTPPTPLPDGPVQIEGVPLYSQFDPAYTHDRYVFTPPGQYWSIGGVGCTMTAMSMAAAYVSGGEWSPKWTNASPGNYAETLNTLDAHIRHLGSGLRYLNEQHGHAPGIPAGTDAAWALTDEVKQALRRGNPVLIGMTYSSPVGGDGWTRHTVLATGIDEEGRILVNDPATGTQHRLIDYTFASYFGGFDLAEEIAVH